MTDEARVRFPNLREGVRVTLRCWLAGETRQVDVQYNFYEDGRVGEVFCRPFKSGSELEAQLDRFCIAVSYALQHGAGVEDMTRAMGDLIPPEHENLFASVMRGGVDEQHRRKTKLAAEAGAGHA